MTSNLLAQAIARDPRAVRELVDELMPVIHMRIASILLRRGAAQRRDVREEVLDLAQDVFLALLENDGRLLRSWDPKRGMSLKNFVGLIAEQKAEASLRGQGNLSRGHLLDPDELDRGSDSSHTPERIFASEEALSVILERVRIDLGDERFGLFHMLFIEGQSIDDVSRAMLMTPESVYQWRSRLGRRVEQIAREILSDELRWHEKARGDI